MAPMKEMLGAQIAPFIYRCRMCDTQYNVRHGWSSLRRHFKKRHFAKYFQLERSEFFQRQMDINAIISRQGNLHLEKQKETELEPRNGGGTSALLRHLKTIHPAAINFDPENPPPVARRKRRKIEDYTIVTSDTTSYMDNLLGQFFQDDSAAPPPNPDTEDPGMVHVQSRADSEIDEETAQSGAGDTEPDQDLRKLLGIDDMSPVRTEITAGCSVDVDEPQFPPILVLPHASPDEEKQVSSSSGSAKKRKTEDLAKSMDLPDNYKHGKFSLSLMSGIRRSTPHALGQQPISAISAHLSPPPPIATSSEHAKVPTIPSKYNENAVSILDFEAKVLYNQSMHSTIAREDAMATYYRRKTRKLELEIKKLERELGEGSRAASTMDEHDE